MSFNASFICRKSKMDKSGTSPIELSIVIDGKRTYIQLPKRCAALEFKGMLSTKKENDVKIYCQTISAKINEIQTKLTIAGKPITPASIKSYFKSGCTAPSYTLGDMFEEGLRLKSSDNIEPHTYNKYKNAIERFYAFTGHTPTDEVSDIRNADIVLFRNKCAQAFKEATLWKEMQYIKYFFNMAFSNGKISIHPYGNMKIKKHLEDKPFLTADHLKQIRETPISNDKLDRIRDMFLFQCYTGIEYADLVALQPEDVMKNEFGEWYIKKPRVKTGIEYISVLVEDAYEIFSFYGGKLPVISNQKYNKYLKELAKECGIKISLTTLTARHTYACFLLNDKKIPISILQKILGHTNPQQSLHYAKMLDNTVFKAFAENKKPVSPEKPSYISYKKELSKNEESLTEFRDIMGIVG